MSSIVIAGDTSGSVTLQAPAVSGSTVLNLPATSGTIQASGAGYTTNGVAYATSATGLATGSTLSYNGTRLLIGGVSAGTVALSIPAGDITSDVSSGSFAVGNYGDTSSALRLSTRGFTNFITGATDGTNGTEQMRITSVGLGIKTSSPIAPLTVQGDSGGLGISIIGRSTGQNESWLYWYKNGGSVLNAGILGDNQGLKFAIGSGATEAARFDTSGNLLVGTTQGSPAGNNVAGSEITYLGSMQLSRAGATGLQVNRKTDDGELVAFRQDGTQEGNIVVTGTTVSYNGGHLSRYAQTTTAKDDSIFKGTVLSNLDEMNVYTKDGQPVDNEQLNKVKVSDTEGDVNVAGVCVSWSHDEDHNVDEINMAMTGDMIIRIAQGVTVVRGDLLMSAGDGTAKPQGDDIVRSKTVAKVTSNHVTCTYADGSYCVPCVLMAC